LWFNICVFYITELLSNLEKSCTL